MTNPYPLPRQTRETGTIEGDGRATYGPFDFRVFDAADVLARVLRLGETAFTVEPIFAEKVGGQPFDHFTVRFATPLLPGDVAVVQSRRIQERSTDVTRGGAVSGAALEREFSVIGTVLQELRRDVNRFDNLGVGVGGDLEIGDIAGLPSALAGKADRTALAALDGAFDDLTAATATALGAKADLVNGKVPSAQLPDGARVLSFSPFDYGGVGDGVADDTAAVNACFTDLRARSGQTQGPAQGYITQQRLTVDLRGGTWRITGNGIDATNIQAWNMEIKGGLLVGETAGKPILDLVGSRGYSMNGTGFFGVKDPAKRPSKAYVVARNNTGAQACDNTSFIEVSTTGWYSEAAVHVYGHETALHLHCTYFNYDPDACVAIYEGFNAHPISSAFSGIQTGPVSFINNKVDICDFRYLPVDENIRSIANITIGANPTVTTSTAHAFANGDKVVFAHVGGQGALQREVATVANATSTTFTAQGVTTTGTFTGGGNVIRAQTMPSVYLSRAQDFNFDSCYIVAYGQPHVEVAFPDTTFPRMDDIQLDILCEGSGQNHNVAFTTGGRSVSIQGFELTTYNSAAKVSVMGASGGQVSLYDVDFASYNQQGAAEMALPLASFAFYGADVIVPLPSYASPAGYAAFKGRVSAVSDGSVADYGVIGGNSGPSGPLLIEKTSGTGGDGVSVVNNEAGGAYFGNFVRLRTTVTDIFTVRRQGHVSMGSTAHTSKVHLRVQADASFGILNDSESAQLFNVSQAGNVNILGSVGAASFTASGGISASGTVSAARTLASFVDLVPSNAVDSSANWVRGRLFCGPSGALRYCDANGASPKYVTLS